MWVIPGSLLALGMVVWGAFLKRLLAGLAPLLLGVVIGWFALAGGTMWGYTAWQTIPDPPAEAFADGAKLTASVMVGWLPYFILLVPLFCLLRGGVTVAGRRRGELEG